MPVPSPRLFFALALSLANVLTTYASPGVVTISLDPPGPVRRGDTFRVTFRMSQYTDGIEIDAVRFGVNYPASFFAFVNGSFVTAPAGDTPWLAKSNQETTGFTLASTSDGSTPGRVDIHLHDGSASNPERGTVALDGFLVSFELRAQGGDTGLIRAVPYAGPTGDETLYNPAGAPAGVPSFNPAFKAIEAGQFLSIARAGTNVVVSWLTTPPGFVLQYKINFNSGAAWIDSPAAVVVAGDRNRVTVPAQGAALYFRLR